MPKSSEYPSSTPNAILTKKASIVDIRVVLLWKAILFTTLIFFGFFFKNLGPLNEKKRKKIFVPLKMLQAFGPTPLIIR